MLIIIHTYSTGFRHLLKHPKYMPHSSDSKRVSIFFFFFLFKGKHVETTGTTQYKYNPVSSPTLKTERGNLVRLACVTPLYK